MVFDHIRYTRENATVPSALAWETVFQWSNPILANDGGAGIGFQELRVTNNDGSLTIYRGEELLLDANGVPIGGDVDSIQRWDAGQTVRYESYDFREGISGGQAVLTDIWQIGVGPELRTADDEYQIRKNDLLPAEAAGAGIDTVLTDLTSFTLGANFENLEKVGGGNFAGTGNALDNTIIGATGDDTLDGRTGVDTMIGGLGNDTYFVDVTEDSVIEAFGEGTDTVKSFVNVALAANVENGQLLGTTALSLTGNELANILTGNSATNVIVGGAGIDVLIGGRGRDSMTGGINRDIFDFNSRTETGVTSTTRDIITDFQHLVDDIDFRTIDASTLVSGNNNFVWRGTGAFTTSQAGEVRFQKFNNAGTANDYTIVYGDIDGDTASEFQIMLKGLVNLTSADFIL